LRLGACGLAQLSSQTTGKGGEAAGRLRAEMNKQPISKPRIVPQFSGGFRGQAANGAFTWAPERADISGVYRASPTYLKPSSERGNVGDAIGTLSSKRSPEVFLGFSRRILLVQKLPQHALAAAVAQKTNHRFFLVAVQRLDRFLQAPLR